MVVKVLLLNPFDAHAGSQRIGRDVIETLIVAGYDVRARIGFGGSGFLSSLPRVIVDLDCSSVRIRKILYPLWSLLVSLPVALAALSGWIVWANTVYAALPSLLAALVCPHRVVLHLHETNFPGIFRPLLRLMQYRGVSLVCVSADHADRIGLPATVLPNAVDVPACDVSSARNRLLFVGTTQPIKGLSLFVVVCKDLIDFPLQKVAYLSDEARHDKDLVEAARQAGIDVIFGESSPDILYRDGFLLLQATDPMIAAETFSLVAVEAMARLVPVGSGGVTVLSEVLADALAFDIPSRDPKLISNAIRSLYADRDRQDALRAACTRRRPLYSKAAFAERILKFLRQMDTRSR